MSNRHPQLKSDTKENSDQRVDTGINRNKSGERKKAYDGERSLQLLRLGEDTARIHRREKTHPIVSRIARNRFGLESARTACSRNLVQQKLKPEAG